MAIITISRGSLSGGQRLAECVSDALGYRIISREDLVQEGARRYGVVEEHLQRALEQAPSFWDRFRVDRQIYRCVAQATLCSLIRDDDVVYHGHAGHLLLRDVTHVLRVRLIVPLRERIRYAMTSHGYSESEAEAFIRKRDEERVSWTRFLYGIEWGDPALYDITLNLERISMPAACQTLAALVEREEFLVTDEHRQRLDNLFLAAHVQAKLFLNPKVAAAAAKLEITADAGAVHLSGILPGDNLLEEVLATCRSLPEVKETHAEWLGARVEPV
jgi:cytidylate kinase